MAKVTFGEVIAQLIESREFEGEANLTLGNGYKAYTYVKIFKLTDSDGEIVWERNEITIPLGSLTDPGDEDE